MQDVVLHLGDCLSFMRTLEDGAVDAVVTDPPYGIGEHGGACRTRGRPGYAKHERRDWDKQTPSSEVFKAILATAETVCVWGGNYFSDKLPSSMGWLYWRKLMGGDFSDGELAWTSKQMALREFTKCPKGIDKTHPCEKPIEVMVWCMEVLGIPRGATVFDPFMGSGTTGVACVRTGRNFIGCEIDAQYFAIAQRRIADAQLQPPLFPHEPQPQAQQLPLDTAHQS